MPNKLFDPFLKRREAQSALEEIERGVEQSRQEREREEEQSKLAKKFQRINDLFRKLDEITPWRIRGVKKSIAIRREFGTNYVSSNPHKLKLRSKRRAANRVARRSRKRNRV